MIHHPSLSSALVPSCIIRPILVKITPLSFNFVRNNFSNFVLALQNEQIPPFYRLRLAAKSGNLKNSDFKLLFISIKIFCLTFHFISFLQ